MYCSLFYSDCIADLIVYVKAAKSWAKKRESIEFWYMDSLANDNTDLLTPITTIPTLRFYDLDAKKDFADLKINNQRLSLDDVDYLIISSM